MGRTLLLVPKPCTSLVGGGGGSFSQKIFKFGGSEMLFSALVMRCLRKIDLKYENSKQLQVTTIKITESKENKSIHRLDLSGSTGPGDQAPPPPPPPSLATAMKLSPNEFRSCTEILSMVTHTVLKASDAVLKKAKIKWCLAWHKQLCI